MTIKPDASHRMVLENWTTIEQMNACLAQMDGFIQECARRVLLNLERRQRARFRGEERVHRRWVQLYPLGDEEEGRPLALGVEEFSVDTLLDSTGHSGECLAYVFRTTPDHQEHADLLGRFGAVTPPAGFDSNRDEDRHGYIYLRHLPRLSAAELCDVDRVEAHLTEPLSVLIEWYGANEAAIRRALHPVQRR